MYWLVRFFLNGPGKKKRKKGGHVAYSCRMRQVLCPVRHKSFSFCFTSVIYFHGSAIKNPDSAKKRFLKWRTRHVLLPVRQNVYRDGRLSGCLNDGLGLILTYTEGETDGVLTSPAWFVSDPSKILPVHKKFRHPFWRIRHILTRTRHFPPRVRLGCMTRVLKHLPDTVFFSGKKAFPPTLLRRKWRTRQIFRLIRSISSRIGMFTKFSSLKKTPDAGKNVRVRQSFWLVRQKRTLQPFYFGKKTPESGIILPGDGKNMRALPVT